MRKGSLLTARNNMKTLTRPVTFLKNPHSAAYQQQSQPPKYAAQPIQHHACARMDGDGAVRLNEELEEDEKQIHRDRQTHARQAPARYRGINFDTNFGVCK